MQPFSLQSGKQKQETLQDQLSQAESRLESLSEAQSEVASLQRYPCHSWKSMDKKHVINVLLQCLQSQGLYTKQWTKVELCTGHALQHAAEIEVLTFINNVETSYHLMRNTQFWFRGQQLCKAEFSLASENTQISQNLNSGASFILLLHGDAVACLQHSEILEDLIIVVQLDGQNVCTNAQSRAFTCTSLCIPRVTLIHVWLRGVACLSLCLMQVTLLKRQVCMMYAFSSWWW